MTPPPPRRVPPPMLPSAPPRRRPTAGDVLEFGPQQWRYGSVPIEPLRFEVTRVRGDISWWYGGDYVWLEGWVLDDDGKRVRWRQILVVVDSIPDASAAFLSGI